MAKTNETPAVVTDLPETPVVSKKRTLVQKFAPGLIVAATLATVVLAVKNAKERSDFVKEMTESTPETTEE